MFLVVVEVELVMEMVTFMQKYCLFLFCTLKTESTGSDLPL